MLWYFRGVGISSGSGQGGGGWNTYPWPLYFILREHSMNEHKRQLQLSSGGHTALRFSMLGSREKCGDCFTALSFPPARAGEAPPAAQLCLSSGTWHWQWSGAPFLYHCLVPSSKGKRGWVCPLGVAKVAIAVAYPWFGLPCESWGREQRAVLLVTNEWMMSPGCFPRQEIYPK